MDNQAIISHLKIRIEQVVETLNGINNIKCIEKHNTICCWPETGLTVAVDDNGHIQISNKDYAWQYTPEEAKYICENVTNGHGQHPIQMTPKEYYNLILKQLEESLILITPTI